MRNLIATLILTTALSLTLPAMAQAPTTQPAAAVIKTSVSAPAVKTEVPAVKTEAPAVKTEAPATQPAVSATKTAEPTPEPTVSEWWKVLLKRLMELVFTILGIMATVLVTVLMKKYGFENYSSKVNDILLRGTAYAEQMSVKAAKLSGKPLAGAEKMELALGFVTDMAKQYKLPDKGKEFWTKKVEGWLGVQNQSNGT